MKKEADDSGSLDASSKSDWLFGNGLGISAQPPPLVRRPQTVPGSSPVVFPDDCKPSSPPAKRARKGTPHKLNSETCAAWEVVDDDADIELPPLIADGGTSEPNSPIEIDQDSSSSHEFVCNDDSMKITFLDDENEGGRSAVLAADIDWPVFSTPEVRTESQASASSPNWQNTLSRKSVPPCEICGRCFPTKEKMADHKRSHSEIKQFSCLMCNRFFKYRRGVTNHLKEVHRLKDRNEISSLVASHEIGRVPVKDASGKKHWIKETELSGEADPEMAETKVTLIDSAEEIQDLFGA